mgnify:CR=1 FL=1
MPPQTEVSKRIKRDVILWRTLEIANALGVAITALASLKNPLYLLSTLPFLVGGYISQINIDRKKSRLAV